MGHGGRHKRFGRPTGRHTIANKLIRRQQQQQRAVIRKQALKNSFFSCLSTNDSGFCTVVIRKVNEPKPEKRDGYRMINLWGLNMFMLEVSRHMVSCSKAHERIAKGQDTFKLVGSTKNSGIACSMSGYCLACAHRFCFDTSPKVKVLGQQHYDINVRAVWGQMSCGGGCSKLRECLNTMGSPSLSQPHFTKIEHSIGKAWGEKANEEMFVAAAEERAHAVEVGSLHEGVPSITVVCDGGWSKRSHKHTYNALGGVGVIIGLQTKKLLHVGVRTKTCAVCSHAETNQTKPRDHECFKNWNSSSQAMEADVMLEGFNQCEGKYGIRYTKIVADGDSSTLATLSQHGPPWCRTLQKLECANHSLKCLRGHLEKLVESKPHYKGKNRLTKLTRERICKYVRYAIRLRSLSSDQQGAVRLLKQDVLNSLNHSFGLHTNCQPEVCRVKQGVWSTTSAPTIDNTPVDPKESDVLDTVSTNIAAWKDVAGDDEALAARGGRPGGAIDVEADMRHDVMLLLNRFADKAERLIGNFTTNLAESWMSLRAKFDGGKFLDRCKRGSWQARCYGAALRKNLGPDWSAKVWEEITQTSATPVFHTLGSRVAKARCQTARCVGQAAVRRRRWRRKRERDTQNATRQAKRSYGPQVLDDSNDASHEEVRRQSHAFYVSRVCKTEAECESIEKETRDQAASGRWQEERRLRLTASNFGVIMSKKATTKLAPTIVRLLYSKFQGTASTRYGLQQERATKQEYELKQAQHGTVTVEACGLVVNPQFPFLGASPDGIVYIDGVRSGLLEVKNVLKDKPITLDKAAESPAFCLRSSSGHLQLRESHAYFHQCMGQLHITGLPWLDFVVRSQDPYQFFLQRLTPNHRLWKEVMLPKLERFFFQALLPELALPRYGTVSGIREPGPSWNESSDALDQGTPLSPQPSTSGRQLRPTRASGLTFVGQRIRHEWVMDETTNRTEWFEGSILRLLSGVDGQPGAVYEVAYDGEDDLNEVDLEQLLEDYRDNSLQLL